MPKSRNVRIVASALALIVTVALLVVVVAAVNGRDGLHHSTAALAFGWTVPFIAGALIAVSSWALLVRAPDPPTSSATSNSVRCPRCDAPVLDDWRLCPNCGARLAQVPAPPV